MRIEDGFDKPPTFVGREIAKNGNIRPEFWVAGGFFDVLVFNA